MRQLILRTSSRDLSSGYFNANSGVYAKTLFTENLTVVDDYGIEGYYTVPYDSQQTVIEVVVESEIYIASDSLLDCFLIEKTFFFDFDSQRLYIHFDGATREFDKEILIGLSIGYSNNYNPETRNIYGNVYYEPLLKSVSPVKRSIDPLFFGKLKFSEFKASFINNEGHFDNWRDRNLFNTTAEILFAENPTSITDFQRLYRGFIGNDSRNYTSFDLTIADQRQNLDQDVTVNRVTLAEYSDALPADVGKPKPIAYGTVRNVTPLRIVQADPNQTWLFADTENLDVQVGSVKIYKNNIWQNDPVNPVGGVTFSIDESAGTFKLKPWTASDEITCDFTVELTNGVALIKTLIELYDEKPFIPTFWNIDEVNESEILCRNTGVFIDDDTKLKELIEQICFDCDLRFFVQDDGKYTIRIYQSDREPVATILWDDWTSEPSIDNNGVEYLTSCVIEYLPDYTNDKYLARYENKDFEADTFDIYKKIKSKTFKTNLFTEAESIDKSNTIMNFSKEIQDVVDRSVNWNFKGLEIGDFVLAEPRQRVKDRQSEVLKIWEVLSVSTDFNKYKINLTLRYVKEA